MRKQLTAWFINFHIMDFHVWIVSWFSIMGFVCSLRLSLRNANLQAKANMRKAAQEEVIISILNYAIKMVVIKNDFFSGSLSDTPYLTFLILWKACNYWHMQCLWERGLEWGMISCCCVNCRENNFWVVEKSPQFADGTCSKYECFISRFGAVIVIYGKFYEHEQNSHYS